MGNFYTNIALRTEERQGIIDHMRERGRLCFVSPTSRGFTAVYDRICEDQNVADLEALTTELSARFHCLAFAVLNHHDDVLWIGLARDGRWMTTYVSDEPFSGSAWRIASEFGVLGLLPLLWASMRWPLFLFQIWRHGAIASSIGLPDFTVGFGYEYLSRGERPSTPGTGEFESH